MEPIADSSESSTVSRLRNSVDWNIEHSAMPRDCLGCNRRSDSYTRRHNDLLPQFSVVRCLCYDVRCPSGIFFRNICVRFTYVRLRGLCTDFQSTLNGSLTWFLPRMVLLPTAQPSARLTSALHRS